MAAITLLERSGLSVIDYRCEAERGARPFAEAHEKYSLSYVYQGSFGCKTVAGRFELVVGSVLLGHPGDEYVCSHEHAHGDRCLSFQLEPELVDDIGSARSIWRQGRVQPLPELMVLGALAQATASGAAEVGLDEVGLLFAGRLCELVTGVDAPCPAIAHAERRRAVQAALFIEEHAREPLELATLAREARLSPFHFLRSFASVLGVTPHQYLLRCRLRHAAQLLIDESRPIIDIALDVGFNDLSNFVRTFRRASGVSPREFRKASRGERQLLSARWARAQPRS
jgi:AraC family transcriptional regulator